MISQGPSSSSTARRARERAASSGRCCPLPVLEERERARADERTPGQARAQFDRVHTFTVYDLEVDTSILSPEECAARIKERLDGAAPDAFRRLFRPMR